MDSLEQQSREIDSLVRDHEGCIKQLQEQKRSLFAANVVKMWEIHSNPSLKAVEVDAVYSGNVHDGCEIWYTNSSHRREGAEDKFDSFKMLGSNIFRTKNDAIDNYVRRITATVDARAARDQREMQSLIDSKDGHEGVDLDFPDLARAEQQELIDALKFYADRAHYRMADEVIYDAEEDNKVHDLYKVCVIDETDPGWKARVALDNIGFHNIYEDSVAKTDD